jgi:flagellar biogenesis protein FliO
MGTQKGGHRAGVAAVIAAAAIAWTAAAPLCARAQAAGAASSPASLSSVLPLKRDEPSDAPLRAMLAWAAVLVIAAAGAGYFVLVRSGRLGKGSAAWGRRQADLLRRGSSLPLSQNASVHVVQWGSEEYLLASTAHGVTLLDKRSLQPSAEASGQAPDQGGRSE